MTLLADIRTCLQSVVGDTDILGETWSYRRLTSGGAAETRTYGAWTSIIGHFANRMTMEDYDPTRDAQRRVERCTFRVSDASTVLYQGDQIRDASNVAWAVTGVASQGVGTIAYQLERDLPMVAEPGRGGNR